MIFLYIIPGILISAAAAFISWFFSYKAMGKCPLCALKKLLPSSKITIDIDKESKYQSSAASTPPMGWSSWNTFRQNISEDIILDTAKAMKATGLLDAGYKYVNLDDCWHSSLRDENGRMQSDFEKFPLGIPHLSKELNSLGFKLGLYSSNGSLTCEDLPASLGREQTDADTFASWGCEFLKYDFCHHEFISGDAPAIEGIEISEIGKTAHIRLFAKDAELCGKAKVIPMHSIPHKEAIGRLNHGAGSASFKVNAEKSGEYILTLLFCKSKSVKGQYLQVITDDEIYEVFFPKSKAYSPTGRAQIAVELKQGENKIVLKNPIVTRADSAFTQYRRMGRALKNASEKQAAQSNAQEKPITFSICEWGVNKPWMWGAKAGNLWRTTHDIFANWFRITHIYKKTLKLYKYSSPGAWNDPDMLEVGNGKLTEDENKSHFALWCMLASPLILGNDIRKFISSDGEKVNSRILDILTNKALIEIDQDRLGKSAKKLFSIGLVDVIARPLANGDIALCLLNRGFSRKNIKFNLSRVCKDSYAGLKNVPNYEIHEIIGGETFMSDKIMTTLKKHESKVYRITAM